MVYFERCEVTYCCNYTCEAIAVSAASWMRLCEFHQDGLRFIPRTLDIQQFLHRCRDNIDSISVAEYDAARQYALDVRANIIFLGDDWIFGYPPIYEIDHLIVTLIILWPRFHPGEEFFPLVLPTC
jgi:hypothetical protein